MTELVIACIAFVGMHFLLSHPLRRPLVARIGEGPFLGLYSLVAFATFAWIAYAFYMAPKSAPLWAGFDDGPWLVATVLMLIASILFVGSMAKNPAAPNPEGAHDLDRPATGVFAITRHPMMWAFSLWGISHIIVRPTDANIVLCIAIVVLALIGAALQDRKKGRLFGDAWRTWEGRTSYVPFARQFSGAAHWSAAVPALRTLLIGVIVWMLLMLAHGSIGAGVWRWLS